MGAGLRLGPMLRHVTDTTATIWVETDSPCRVTVATSWHTAGADTFTVHGHHYAVCELTGLPPGAMLPYEVRIDDAVAWPEPDSAYPPSLVRTVDHDAPARIMFGSCHTSTDHSARAVARYGVDMLRAYALRLADLRCGEGAADDSEPSLLLLIGDQIYADEIQPRMKAFLAEHRRRPGAPKATGATGTPGATDAEADTGTDAAPDADADGADGPPDDEVVFFDEYAELYRHAWSDPDLRWLLSTVPTLMMFDDHDIRDDWNTSGAWRRDIAARAWWRTRITSGIGAYWVYQHLGNLSGDLRAADPVFADVAIADGDAAPILDAFAARADDDPAHYLWSYRYDIGRSRILMVDTRCGRDVADDTRRTILGADGTAWLDRQVTGGVDHLVVASSLPFLLPKAVHHLEAWNEAVCAGAWGRWLRGPGEKLRREVDLEHWAAFQTSFHALGDAVAGVAAGERGEPPASVLFLGGDVHFSYLARARVRAGEARGTGTAIVQLVCSPTCNRMPPVLRRITRLATSAATALVGAVLARAAGARRPVLDWRLDGGPWYDNSLAALTLDGRAAEVSWSHSPDPRHTVSEEGPAGLAPTARPVVTRPGGHRLTG
ncbi:alkaline phosphatase D family protein [Nocardiopsis mangrovi]|uniref:Alkaline phosphatase D family protein n=1 Tax=Nocardiopsis mangrovi TaxID=1179818 RepID=A0ABV9DXV1_9ACTN